MSAPNGYNNVNLNGPATLERPGPWPSRKGGATTMKNTPTRPGYDSLSFDFRSPLIPDRHYPTKHGHAPRGRKDPTYETWRAMRTRCLNPNSKGYDKHGGRGIQICASWRYSDGFPAFLSDMGERPVSGDYSIERIDNNGHYSCGKCFECIAYGWAQNCKWATRREQGSNKRNNRTFEYEGVRYTIAEAVRVFGIPRGTLVNRHRRGWTGEQIVNQPKVPGVKLEWRTPKS